MSQAPGSPAAFLTFTLHAHLPYVVNHGTWPHGMEWLLEAAAETYIPLLRVLRNLERDRIRFHCNLNLTPILLEQLAHPVFLAEFPRYLTRKIIAAQEDEAFFTQSGETHYAELARFWHRFFTEALDDFNALGKDLVGAFRHFDSTGLISLITCAATHGYLPLLGTDESVRAQIRTAVTAHTRHIGRAPRGVWLPECGYRPAGMWTCPVTPDGSPAPEPFERIGIEQALSESGLKFFFVDTHLVEGSEPVHTPYSKAGRTAAAFPFATPPVPGPVPEAHTLYRPWTVEGPYLHGSHLPPVDIFPRDPRTGLQVWSGDTGYPGDSEYLDFHKKRWPGGHRYWRVTGSRVEMGEKEPYNPQIAARRVLEHAAHFTHIVWQALHSAQDSAAPPILCAPFDAELFGHWWFEGIQWLDAVARNLHAHDTGIQLISCAEYIDRFPDAGSLALHEGSWGAEGTNQVWLNPETSWTWTHIYPAERATRDICSSTLWHDSELGTRIVRQLCRELLLLESSDWQFLITTGAARDYAEARFITHSDQFNELKALWHACSSTGALTPEQLTRLHDLETRDSIFPDIDPSLWATGSHASPPLSS